MLLNSLFRSVPAIETLIIEPPRYIDGLFFERHAFLVNSLKKLYIHSDWGEKDSLSARNAIWLLLFVPQISEVAMSIDFSIIDLRFLLEFGDTIEGLSQVSKPSLHINFVWDDAKPKTWRGLQEEHYQHSAQVNQKTFGISQLLRCVNTSQLVALEIVGNMKEQRMGDRTRLLVECLTVLPRSSNSLLHLRLYGLSFREDRPDSKCFPNFKNMKMLTLEGSILQGLRFYGEEMVIPSSLEVVWLLSYNDERFLAEDHLLQFLKLRGSSLPKLREIIVPESPIFPGKVNVNVENWTHMRERLEKEEIFTSGRVILRKAEKREMSE